MQLSQQALIKKDEKDDGAVLDLGELDLPPPAETIEEILDFYKKK